MVPAMPPRRSNRPKFLTQFEITRMFDLKEAGHKWSVIATKLCRPKETLKKRYFRILQARQQANGLWVPAAILGHREIHTSSGTLAGVEYEVQWVGSNETTFESFSDVRNWEVYSSYNLALQHRALVSDARIIY